MSTLAYFFYVVLSSPFAWSLFVLGLFVGSFLNVCIYRLPRGEFWRTMRSQCPHCQAKIPLWWNLPLLSYVFLRGRARCCKQPISLQYPFVEFVTGLVFFGLYAKYPFITGTLGDYTWFPQDFMRYVHSVCFVCALLVSSLIDCHFRIIPDVITLGMVVLSPVVVFLHPELTWTSSLLGVLLGGGSIYAIAWIYYLVRKGYGIGMGDAKFLAAIGGWLGYQSLFATIFYGSLLGSVFGLAVMARQARFSLKTEIPFGPFLALGALLYMFCGTGVLPRW